jgi:hypothetical protein
MNVKAYIDESGDLGFKFSAPYNHGGSSRYLTISYLILPEYKIHLPKRIAKNVYFKFHFNVNSEIKGSRLTEVQKKYFATKVIHLLNKDSTIHLGAITVKKKNVKNHIREDPNLLYNYMMRLGFIDYISTYENVKLIRDEKSVKIKSGNTLQNYLQTELWFNKKVKTKIEDLPTDSKKNMNLIFVDWITHIIWSKYEFRKYKAYNIILPKLKLKNLFF